MKRVALLAIVAVSPAIAYAQVSSMDIDTVALGAPAKARAATTIIRWHADHATYDTLRQGTNKLVCFDRSGFPEQQPFSIECTTLTNLPRVVQTMKFESADDRKRTMALIDAAEKDGTRIKPEFGSVFYHFVGPDKEHARAEMTIFVPGATSAMLGGLPERNTHDGAWLMDAGKTSAHIMTPGD